MLGPAADLGVHAAGGQRRLQALDRAGDEGLALDPLFFQQARDLLAAVGLQETERKVFHFPLDLPDAEPVGQRRVQVRVSRANSTVQGVLLSACQRSVRSREASRISTMRRSAAMASSILRCISFCEPLSAATSLACRATTPRRSSARVPCTSRATSWPNAAATGSLRSAGAGAVRSVGKAASRAAARVAASVCMPARMRTTPAPCEASDSRSGPAGPRNAARPRPRPGRSAPGRQHPGPLPPPAARKRRKA